MAFETEGEVDLERHDVYELWVSIVPMGNMQMWMDDTGWLTALGLAGVDKLKAVRRTDHASEITGELSTYPSLEVVFLLESKEDSTGKATHCLKRLKISS